MASLTSSIPTAFPIQKLEEVYEWQPSNTEVLLPAIALQPHAPRPRGTPRTLLCHDMNGGYLDDKFVQGVKWHDAYRFFHWSNIDIFVYFSHKFVTIPPSVWIDAAHLHGVKVLGTLITEWTDGAETCEAFLKDADTVNQLVEKLVDITEHFKFDGWLLNIENKIKSEQIPQLVKFVKNLTTLSHDKIPGSVILWYDSVIDTGDLKWQNELNEKNKQFFDACDGIFLNYNWTDEHLQRSAALADNRILDVYAGVDIFGRGTEGGGGFKTNIALEIVRQNKLSTAMFAQGWVYEKLGKDNFTKHEYKFWSLIYHLLPIHGPSHLPFCTSFCQGFGTKYFYRGKMLQDEPWSNLGLQHLQPTSHSFYQQEDFPYRMEININEPYTGGGCLSLSGSISSNRVPILQLFRCHFQLQEPMLIGYVWKKVEPSNANFCLVLLTRDNDNARRVIHLSQCSNETHSNDHCEVGEIDNEVMALKYSTNTTVENLEPLQAKELQDLSANGITDVPEMEDGWEKRLYLIKPSATGKKEKIEVINGEILTEMNSFNVLLGHLHIIPVSMMKTLAPVEVQCLQIETAKAGKEMMVSCHIHWSGGNPSLVECYAVYCGMKWGTRIRTSFIGATRKNHYRVTNLIFPNPELASHKLRFIIQEHLMEGQILPLNSSPYVDVQF